MEGKTTAALIKSWPSSLTALQFHWFYLQELLHLRIHKLLWTYDSWRTFPLDCFSELYHFRENYFVILKISYYCVQSLKKFQGK